MEPVWSCGPILPQSLIDLLAVLSDDNDDDKEEDEVEFDEMEDTDQ